MTSLSLGAIDDDDAFERIVEVRRAVAFQPEGLDALAGELPREVATLPPEVSLELSRLARALLLFTPTLPDDIATLPMHVRVHWRRTQLLCGASSWVTHAADDELEYVLADWKLSAPVSLPVLKRLAGASDVRLRSLAIRSLAPCVAGLTLASSNAVFLLADLAEDPDAAIRAEAVGHLTAPWLFFLTPQAERRRASAIEFAAKDPSDEAAKAALDAAAARGLVDLIEHALADGGRSVAVRQHAMRRLSTVGTEEHIDLLLRIAQKDFLAYGAAARHTLLQFHRRGVFIRERHLDALLSLFDAHAAWTGEELVRVTYIVRAQLIERLGALPPDDARWIRRADILAESFGTGAHEVLAGLLQSAQGPAAAFVDAAGRSAEYEGEERLLRFYDAMPERVLEVLRAKGTTRSLPWLMDQALAPRTPPRLRASIIEVLWALSMERDELLLALAAKLGPDESLLLRRAKPHQERRVAAILAAEPWKTEGRAVSDVDAEARFGAYCASGDPARRDDVIEMFRALYRQCLAKALGGDFAAKRVELPNLEQQLFQYGRHLVAEGRPVRRWLHASPETGRDFLLDVACTWLREGPDDATCVALLETIARHAPSGPVLRFIEPFWRHRHPGVQRAAIEAILSSPDAHGLELSIAQLSVKTTDARVLVQALRGITALSADWAAPMAARCLEHPNMSVKKEAAFALSALDHGPHAGEITQQLVGWLGRHDNSGFRQSLKDALKRSAGSARVAWLVGAAEQSEDPRTMALLFDALSGLIRKETVLLLAVDDRLPELIDACMRGETLCADASQEEITSLLHRAFPGAVGESGDESPAQALLVDGFSADAAASALADATSAKERSALRGAVRRALPEWIRWHLSLALPERGEAAALILDAATERKRGSHDAALLEDALLDCAMGLADALRPGDDDSRRWGRALLAYVKARTAIAAPAEKRKLLALLRSLAAEAPVDGAERFGLLASLGGVRDEADLRRSLAQCASGPDYRRQSVQLLTHALSIPQPSADETEETTKLREDAASFYALSADAGDAWLRATMEARPLGVARLAPMQATRPPPKNLDRDGLRRLVAALKTKEAANAAEALLAWESARFTWPEVLQAYLNGDTPVRRNRRTRLAALIESWPTDAAHHRRASSLVEHLPGSRDKDDAELHRRFIAEWLQRLRGGDASVVELLRAAGERLLPFVADACAGGDFSLLSLLSPSPSLRPFVESIGADRPEVAHLLVTEEPEEDVTLDDPLAGLDATGLLKLIDAKDTPRGLAVRAVHALTDDVDALEGLTTHRRAAVRSASLRLFVRRVDKERGYAVSLQVLHMEDRGEVVLSLMRRLAHGRYAPALPLLVERLSDNDSHMRQHARRAILAWGPDAIEGLRRATKKARPDRRPGILHLISELQGEGESAGGDC